MTVARLITAGWVVTQDEPDVEALLLFGDRIRAVGGLSDLKADAPEAERWTRARG